LSVAGGSQPCGPSRSLIAFTAWSSLVHAVVMGYQGMRGMVAQGELIGVGVLVVIGVALIALAPAKQARHGDQG